MIEMLMLVLVVRQQPPPPQQRPPQEPKLSGNVGEVVAVVGPDAITRREWSEEVAAHAAVSAEDELNILRDLVERQLIRLKAKDLGITVTDEEVAQRTERYETLMGAEQFEEWLAKRGLTRATWPAQAKDEILLRKLQQMRPDLGRDSEPTPREIRLAYALWKDRPPFTRPGSVSLGSLRVSKSELGLEGAAKLIVELHRRAVNGEQFDDIAKSVATGVTYAPIRAESARDEFKNFLKSNPTVGAVSQPIDLGTLLVIVRVEKIAPREVMPFEDSKTQDLLVRLMTLQKDKEIRHRYVESIRGEYVVWPESLFAETPREPKR
jgi:hypothetical protein